MTTSLAPRRVVVFAGQHHAEIFPADTDEQLAAACAAVLRSRWLRNWFPGPSEPNLSAEVIEAEAMSTEQIEALPASLVATVLARRRSAAVRRRHHIEAVTAHQKLVEVATAPSLEAALQLRTDDGRYLASAVADERRDHQYEGFEIVELKTPAWQR